MMVSQTIPCTHEEIGSVLPHKFMREIYCFCFFIRDRPL